MVRAGAIIVLVAALAIAAVGVWLVRSAAPPPSQARANASGAHAPDAHARAVAQAASTPNDAAANTSSSVATSAPPTSQASASAASENPATTSPSAAPAATDGLASSREHAVSDVPAETPSQDESADAKSPAADADASSTSSEDAPVDNSEDAGAPAEAGDANSTDAKPDAIDDDHAADLLADWIARQDAASSDGGDGADANVNQQAWKAFDQEEANADWSQSAEKDIEDTLDQWLAGLPDDVRDHIDVIHVECRETLCQVLAADNDLATQSQRAQGSQEWQQAIATLPQQPWWHELGFVDLSTSVASSNDSGYALYQTYLRREVAPVDQPR